MSRFPLNHFVYVLIMYKQLHRVGVRKEVSTILTTRSTLGLFLSLCLMSTKITRKTKAPKIKYRSRSTSYSRVHTYDVMMMMLLRVVR